MYERIGVKQFNGLADLRGLWNRATRDQFGTGKGEAAAQLLARIVCEISERV